MNEIPDLLKKNDTYLKTCILYEVLHKKPVFESYQNFCEKIGDDTMSYIDFEYWYYRFYNGELDFNCNRTHTQKTFLQLPPEMCDLIFKELSCRERMTMRCVSKVMKAIADGQVEMHESIYMQIRDNVLCVVSFTNIQLETWKSVSYYQDSNKTVIYRETTRKNNAEGNYFEQAKFVYFSDCDAFRFADLTHFYRFKGFSVVLDNLTVEEAIVLRDTLAGLPHFEGCNIYLDNVDLNFLKVGLALEEMPSEGEEVIYRYRIPNSNEFLKFTFHDNLFEVEKMCS
ncbi:hypothetical protein CRE_15690 [Caenorhabditis remanei]|uniref:F-box domain-containing protein n=1 Tax=Caenorhabditis remanei TaxID=31234 RepID=E3N874_CAERE|nr:hypothetical protein CRE_15690 [Caenorhabditis remanei]